MTRLTDSAFATALACSAFVGAFSSAKPPRPLTPVDLLDLPSVSSAVLSPDGESLVYMRSDSDWDANYRVGSVWIDATTPGEQSARQLLHGRKDVGQPRYSADGKYLAFVADGPKGRSNEAYLLPLAGGDAFPLTDHPTSVNQIAWPPSGSDWLYFRATNETPDSDETLRDLIRPYDHPSKSQVWRVRVSDGRREQLTNGPAHVRDYQITEHGLLFLRADGARIDDRHDSSSVWLADADGANARRIESPRHTMSQPRLSPDGKQVLFLADVNEAGEPYYESNLFLLSVDGEANSEAPADGANQDAEDAVEDQSDAEGDSAKGPAQLIAGDLPHEIKGAVWGPDANTIFMLVNYGVHSQLVELDLKTGETRQLTSGDHAIRGWRYDRQNDTFLMLLRTAHSPGEYWRLDRTAKSDGDTPPEPQQLTHLHDGLTDRFLLPEQRLISWKAEDGVELEGLLTLPTDGSLPPYPLVVQSHGGPRSSDQWGVWRWGRYYPVLAAKGYAVLSVNYRGSTGYGEDFHRDMVGNYWRNAHNDVLSGVDHLVETGVADPDRMATMGWSAGGHMTNKLITMTDRFKAASSGAGAVDWVSMFGESDTRERRAPWFGGAPWQEEPPVDAYRAQSPIFDLWRVKTPTLVFVGEEDRRVPRTQSILLVRGLEAAGVPSKLYVAPGQGHGWARLDQRLFKINVELEWFERYVRDRDYEWQSKPKD